MGDVLAQLGIFDLIAVLLSGSSAVTISLVCLKFLCSTEIDFQFMGIEAALLLLVSYLCGLTLQEIGSSCERFFYHGGVWTKFQCDEQEPTLSYVKSIVGDNDAMAYEYCRHFVHDSKLMSRVDRYATTCVMSRSMAIYFFLSAIFIPFLNVVPSHLKFGVWIASIALSIIFFHRFYRFSKLRYNGLYQIFYYANFDEIQKWKTEQSKTVV